MGIESTLSQQISAIRHDMVDVLGKMLEKANKLPNLPPIPGRLESYRIRLIENNYQVLFVGEAKRGKSSFVNALIGRALLPVDVDVATSQVFRLRNAEHEAYRVRFEDNSVLEISAAEIEQYGKQQKEEVADLLSLKKIIRWIEIDLPIHFLPAGISILDTPGVGVLYAAHEQITQRFVPYADAVIFVLDSIQPILQEELSFIEQILAVTPNILFIQTKIDLQSQESWQTILRRNEQILQGRFGERLRSGRIWTISSTYLLDAVQPGEEDDEDYLRKSHFKELATALQIFLFRAAGLELVVQGVQLAQAYYQVAYQILLTRVTSLSEESSEKQLALQKGILARKQHFSGEWGENGKQCKALLGAIQKVITERQQAFVALLEPGNQLEKNVHARIEGCSTLAELQDYHKVMIGDVVSTLLNEWRNTCQQTYTQVQELLFPLLKATLSLSLSPVEEKDVINELTLFNPAILVPFVDTNEVKGQALREGALVEKTLLFLFQFSGSLEEIDVVIAKMASLVWSGVRAWHLHRTAQVTEAKALLHRQMNELMDDTRHKFLGSGNGSLNRVDSFFASLIEDTTKQIEEIVEQQGKEMQEEIDRMVEESRLDETQRKKRVGQALAELAEWEQSQALLKSIASRLQGLEQSFGSL